jgi:hypothetical protein
MAVTDFGAALTADVLQGQIQHEQQVMSADGAITIKSGKVIITKGSALAATLAAPTAGLLATGGDDGKELEIYSTTAFAHTVTIANGLAGAGASADVGTFGAAAANRVTLQAYNGAWYLSGGAAVGVTFA